MVGWMLGFLFYLQCDYGLVSHLNYSDVVALSGCFHRCIAAASFSADGQRN